MKRKFFLATVFALSLAVGFVSCSKDDDSSINNQEPPITSGSEETKDIVLVTELKCTVSEFATKYTTLKKGEKVSVTLTDVSDNNIAQVAAILQKMSGSIARCFFP